MTKDSKTEGGIEIFESPEALQEQLTRTEQFAKTNQKLLIGAGIGILLLVGGVLFFQFNREQQNTEAQVQLFPAQFLFEQDSLKRAVIGNGNTTIGLEAITKDYSGTKAANLAQFYLGVARLKEGKYDEAIDALEDFDAGDYLVQARAYSLIGDAYMEKNDVENAVKYYQQAVSHYPNEQFTTAYMLKLALAYELKKDLNGAANVYKQLAADFPESIEVANALKNQARLEQMMAK